MGNWWDPITSPIQQAVTTVTHPIASLISPTISPPSTPPPSSPLQPQNIPSSVNSGYNPVVTQPKFWTPAEYQAQFTNPILVNQNQNSLTSGLTTPVTQLNNPVVTQPKQFTSAEYQAQFTNPLLVNQNKNPLTSGLTTPFTQLNNPVTKPTTNFLDQAGTNLQNAFTSGTAALGGIAKQVSDFQRDNPGMAVPPVGALAAMITPDKTDPSKTKWDVWNENLAKATTQKLIPDDATLKTMTGGPTANFTRGFIGQFRDRPLDVGIDIGTAILMELASGGTASPAAAEIALGGGGLRTLVKTAAAKAIPYVGPSMMTLYGGSAIKNILDQPTSELQGKQLGGETARFLTAFGPDVIKSGLVKNIADSPQNNLRTLYKNINDYSNNLGLDLNAALSEKNGIEHLVLANGDTNKVLGIYSGEVGRVPKKQITGAIQRAIDDGESNLLLLHTHPGPSSIVAPSLELGLTKISGDIGSDLGLLKMFKEKAPVRQLILGPNSDEWGKTRNLLSYAPPKTIEYGTNTAKLYDKLDNQGRQEIDDLNSLFLNNELPLQSIETRLNRMNPTGRALNKLDELLDPVKIPVKKAQFKLSQRIEPYLYTDTKQVRIFDNLPGVDAVRIDTRTPMDTEYTGIRDLKKMVSNLGSFGGKTDSKRSKPKSNPKKKHISTKLQRQPNKDIVKNCWEISMEPLVPVKKPKPVQKPKKNTPTYTSNKQFDKTMDDILYGSQKITKNHPKKEIHAYTYKKSSSNNMKQLDKLMDDVVYGSQEMSGKSKKHKLENKHQTDRNNAAYTPLSKLAHW